MPLTKKKKKKKKKKWKKEKKEKPLAGQVGDSQPSKVPLSDPWVSGSFA